MNILKEACVGNYLEAKRAEELGAHRLELCDNLLEGGTTPSIGTIKIAKENLNIPVFVIIRPRGGDFVFNEKEIKIMEENIKMCESLGIPGIVIGALTKDNEIDKPTVKRLIKAAKGMSISFHMAFDEIEDKKEAIDTLIELGVNRILTKGGIKPAAENLDSLKSLVEYADNRITILAGGGITKGNFQAIVEKTGVKEVHGTKIVGSLE